MTDPQEREDLRHAVLEVLAVRHPAGLNVRSVTREAKKEFNGVAVTESDVEGALEMLRGLGFAIYNQDQMGATKYWSATSAGVLQYERVDEANPPGHD